MPLPSAVVPRPVAPVPGTIAQRPVDTSALARWHQRLESGSQPPWLHAEVARRMAQRLALIKRMPGRLAAWWPEAGGGLEELARAYPAARVDEVVTRRRSEDRHRGWWRRWISPRRDVREAAEVGPGAYGLVWSNMMLHAMPNPLAVFQAWSRALAVDGFLMFSTLGPGSLPQLRTLYERQGWGPAMADLVDMHDLGDMLVEAGLGEPVMDQELLTLTWSDPARAIEELRSLGSNAHPARASGCRTLRWREALFEALREQASARADGRIELSFEIVYGHAFKPPPRVAVAPLSTVAAEDLRAMARSSRRSATGPSTPGSDGGLTPD